MSLCQWEPPITPSPQPGQIFLTVDNRWCRYQVETRNKRNRTLRPAQVIKLGQDFASGRYIFDASPVRYDHNGDLIDGQHRLHALAQYLPDGVTVMISVVFGLSPNAYKVIDGNVPRTATDMHAHDGYRNTRTLAACVRLIDRWDPSTGLAVRKPPMSMVKQAEIVAADPTIVDSVQFVSATRALRCMAPASVTSFCHWLFSRCATPSAASQFIQQVADGANLPPGDGRLLLARYLNHNANPDQYATCAVFIKAWNLHRKNQLGLLLLFKPSDRFPIPL